MTQRIIAIMAHQRSGTHLLGSSAATHPMIKYTGEIFGRRMPQSQGEVLAMIDRVRGGGFPVICLDAKYNQISRALEALLAHPEVKVIHLVRRNLLRLYFSGELHSWRSRHPGETAIPQFRFDGSRFDRLCRVVKKHKERFGYLADLELFYEQLTGNRDIEELPEWASQQICLLAGVDYRPLAARIRKEAPPDIFAHFVGVPKGIVRHYERGSSRGRT
jgi:hypothetical protein